MALGGIKPGAVISRGNVQERVQRAFRSVSPVERHPLCLPLDPVRHRARYPGPLPLGRTCRQRARQELALARKVQVRTTKRFLPHRTH